MNTHTSRFTTSGLSRHSLSSRAQYSPVLPRNAQAALTRNRLHPKFRKPDDDIVPPAETLTPDTPVLNRWWDPHLIDRLQTQLTRFRD